MLALWEPQMKTLRKAAAFPFDCLMVVLLLSAIALRWLSCTIEGDEK